MRFVDFKIRTKLSIAFGILVLTAILMSVDTLVTLFSFQKKITFFTNEFLPQLKISNKIGDETHKVAFNMEGYYLTGKSGYFEKAKKQLDSLKASLDKGELLLSNSKELDKLEQSLSESKILIPQHEQTAMMSFKLFQEIELLQNELKSAQDKAKPENQSTRTRRKTINPANSNPEIDQLNAEIAEKVKQLDELKAKDGVLLANLEKASDDLDTSVINYTTNIALDFNKTMRYTMSFTVLIVFISLLFAFFAIVYISRLLAVPMVKGIEFAQKLIKGDLTGELEVKQNDELGILGKNLQLMSSRFREILTYVSSSAENMLSASLELSSNSQIVSQGASEQASSAEEISAAIEEMAANIHQNNENAKITEQIAIKAEQNILVGSTKVHQTIDAMREIAEKTSIIGDIAFQTNILALNAAVEAARAGEHGRGFGVVAAEVGKLAERCKTAALDIDKLTKTSVKSAEEAGKLMNEIVPEIQKTSQLVQEISSASREQSTGAEQINSAIQQLNMVTQQNAATSEELSTNAVELSAQSEQLKEIISFFNIGNETRIAIVNQNNTPNNIEVRDKPEIKKGVIIELDEPDTNDVEFERF
jgi:methyl-accepting chemotaxis protein